MAGLVIGAVFILPFLLFSATAGQLADLLDKARVMRMVKNLELAIMALAAWGLWQGWIALLLGWDRPIQAGIVGFVLAVQLALMVRFLRSPVERATWFSGLGVALYVSGMMASAVAVSSFGAN